MSEEVVNYYYPCNLGGGVETKAKLANSVNWRVGLWGKTVGAGNLMSVFYVFVWFWFVHFALL